MHSGASTNTGITFKHDLLETMWCIDAQVNAKPLLDWIYTAEMCVVLYGWLLKASRASQWMRVNAYGLQKGMHNKSEHSCTCCGANYKVKGSCE